MIAFEYSQLPARVVFGFGTIARIPDEVKVLGCRRVLVLCDPHHAADAAARVIDTLGDAAVGLSIDAAMHTPVEITDRVMEQVRKTKADCLLSLGGGSTTGLGKALALRTDLPQIVVPTTYAGSEATPILGQTEQGRKTTIRSPKVLPEVVVYRRRAHDDPAAPPFGCVGHQCDRACSRGLVCERRQSGHLVARRGGHIPAGARASRIVADPHDRDARADALFGAWACGNCLGTVGMLYITSFATRSAEVSIFLTPILMPWCCRMSLLSTQPPHGKQSIGWRTRSALRMPRQACSTSRLRLARRQRSSLSGCRNGIWTRPLISRRRHPIGIRKRSNATRSVLCSTTHFTGAVRRTDEWIWRCSGN